MITVRSKVQPRWRKPHIILAGISTVLVVIVVGLLLILFAQSTPRATDTLGQGYLHTSGSQILDAQNQPVRIAGINWFGLETPSYAPHGLDVRGYKEMLDQIKSQHYNTIRLPYSTQLLATNARPTGIDYGLNADLKDLSGLALIDKIVDYAGFIGLRIILDRHRITADAQSPLWYTAQYPESRWISDWKLLAEHYKDNPTVIGADLHNEPQEQACWGCGDSTRDWQRAAQKAGNEILQVNPNWLIFVQGVSCYAPGGGTGGGDCYWWGGNLQGVRTTPIQLSVPNRLVYSVHDYAPSLHNHSWFDAPDFPDNMSQVWDSYWGYIQKEHLAPVWVGEFGTKLEQQADRQWLSRLVSYLGTGTGGINWAFWSWNPDSADTGGILNSDWKTINEEKQQMLQPILPPYQKSDGQTAATVTPDGQTPTAIVPGQVSLTLGYQNGNSGDSSKISPQFKLTNTGSASINLRDITIRYWLTSDTANPQGQEFHCDYAALDCKTAITGKIVAVTPPRQSADSYLEVGFTTSAGKLDAGKDTGEIKVRLNNAGFVHYDEKNDYSYSQPGEGYMSSTRITVYYKGKLVAGKEPV